MRETNEKKSAYHQNYQNQESSPDGKARGQEV
jgi:hypothetical protein